ncbi:hypothetical protein TSAR_016657 [Trichomalopsis sarcophagae]|uniref:Uncharacterized protein n=1 Tax=Trichomalopsis sarcophagae TaxID=543379 RepID=A0A232F045_9HYME|nr:hypothetical protein TSAR_016657 [Trichomalopsis sarcophagae]
MFTINRNNECCRKLLMRLNNKISILACKIRFLINFNKSEFVFRENVRTRLQKNVMALLNSKKDFMVRHISTPYSL